VIKTQGRHGEVAAELHTDFPERFEERKRIFALAVDGWRRELQLESFWPHQDLMVFKFAGVDSISDAEALLKCELQIAQGERAELEPGTAYVSDLAGCTVFDGEREIGQVVDVQFGAGEAPLLIVKGGKQYEIPFAEAYLKSVDTGRKQIRMQLPEGMLDVNAPLTAEEKERQKKSS
jgi:16S rRNA processing protein RimM